MDGSKAVPLKEMPLGIDATTEDEYASQSRLLQEFTSISSFDKAWIKSDSRNGSQAMFSISQPNLLANKRRKFILSSHISKGSSNSVKFEWAPFPVEMTGVSVIVPSPSGSKLLVVRNPEAEASCQFEIWGPAQVEKEFHIPHSVHGSVYADEWEYLGTLMKLSSLMLLRSHLLPSQHLHVRATRKLVPLIRTLPTGKDKGNGRRNEGKPMLEKGSLHFLSSTLTGLAQFGLASMSTRTRCKEISSSEGKLILNFTMLYSGDTQAVKGIEKHLSVGQVVWAPSVRGSHQYLVFVGWSADTRKLGIKYCYNRPCALYAVKAPLYGSEADGQEINSRVNSIKDSPVVNLTESISSAYHPRFSPDGKLLLFLSSRSAVDSGAHSATDSLHRIDWPIDGVPCSSFIIFDVIPVVMCADDGCFPGLYCSSFLSNPWFSDAMVVSSFWGSCQVVLSVNVLSGEVLRISPTNSNFSWNVLSLDGDNIIAVSSSLVNVPRIKYGYLVDRQKKSTAWNWLDVPSPTNECSEKVESLLSSLQFSIMNIPVRDVSDSLTKGAGKPFEAIFVSSKTKRSDSFDPLIVFLHGGPHTVSLSSFSKSLAFLCTIGFNLLLVNYRGSLGFGEEALQSLPGNIGSQDVNDVLVAVDHVIDMGLASPSKIAVLGGSHGGFLTTHLIGQAPEKFFVAATRNPACNLALMVGTTDIPDWCYVEAYGTEGKNRYTEAPSAEHLALFHSKSPISQISKAKTPTLFLLGAQDIRLPICSGLQYARALKEKGVAVKVIVFPNDNHPIDKPQSDFESFLNIGVWFKRYLF